jgi:hypothetical protein
LVESVSKSVEDRKNSKFRLKHKATFGNKSLNHFSKEIQSNDFQSNDTDTKKGR